MALNDELYSRLVSLYDGLDNQQINELNARLIILFSEGIKDLKVIKKIFDNLEDYKNTILQELWFLIFVTNKRYNYGNTSDYKFFGIR